MATIEYGAKTDIFKYAKWTILLKIQNLAWNFSAMPFPCSWVQKWPLSTSGGLVTLALRARRGWTHLQLEFVGILDQWPCWNPTTR